MKVLVVHNFYREPGGEDECVRSEVRLLEEHGHEVVLFSRDNHTLRRGVGALAGSLWKRESYAALRRLIRKERPQVAHFHNTFYVASPSVYWAAAAEGVPVVQSLHNYRLLCCNALLFRDGAPCEDCVGRIPWRGVVRSCHRDELGASLAVATVTTAHRAMRTWRDRIDTYVALSEFSRSRFAAGGLPADKIVVKPNFIDPDPGAGPGDGGFALFAGRLSREKGVETLLAAWGELAGEIPLRIVGDGPLASCVDHAARQGRVQWVRRRPPSELYEEMGRARCLVVPSECYENFPRVIVEAMAKGTPIVVSDAGAGAEIVRDGVLGLHYRSGDSADLSRAVRKGCFTDFDSGAMRRRVRREYEEKYTGTANHRMLLAIYARAAAAHCAEAAAPRSPRDLTPTEMEPGCRRR